MPSAYSAGIANTWLLPFASLTTFFPPNKLSEFVNLTKAFTKKGTP